jgi:sugar phosphate isomerase/epimerase
MTEQTDSRASTTESLVPRETVLVAIAHDLDHELGCIRDYDVGAEVQTFSFPGALASDYTEDLHRMAEHMRSVKGPVGCHGAFIDTCHYSPDPEIRKVSHMRYMQSLDIAETLGAEYVLFHSQYNTMLKLEAFPDMYHEGSMAFWPEFVAEAAGRNITVYVENMFDETPVAMRRLADAIDSPFFKLCLDVAHSQIHGSLPVEEWIAGYGPHLRHVHINDCRGVNDDHLGLGQGSLDLHSALKHLRETGLSPTFALETNKHSEASLKYLGLDRS